MQVEWEGKGEGNGGVEGDESRAGRGKGNESGGEKGV